MGQRSYASGAKLPYGVIEQLRDIKDADRDTFAAYAEQHGVHLETVRRAYKGLTFQRPLHKQLEDDWRECIVCKALYCRRRCGRRMEKRHWDKKQTCSQRCLIKLKRGDGYVHPFDHKRAESLVPLHSIIEADGHLRQDPSERLEGRPRGD